MNTYKINLRRKSGEVVVMWVKANTWEEAKCKLSEGKFLTQCPQDSE
jgi:hypothetical protein